MVLETILDLEKAFRRVQQDKRDDPWPDVVGYRDYRPRLQENIEELAGRIAEHARYTAGAPLGIDLPKRGFTLRPGIVPLLQDRIVYQGISDFLAPYFNPEPCVYNNRLSADQNSSRMFVHGVRLWLEFQEAVAERCHQYAWVVETDLTAYFEHIRHDLLLSRIDDLFRDSVDRQVLGAIQELLGRLWSRWSGGVVPCGVPQMNDASSFFANVYLDEFDKWMLRNGYEYVRYVDDMRVFAETEPGARRALADLIRQLRAAGLYVGSSKTHIRESRAVLDGLGEGRHRIEEIEADLQSGARERMDDAASKLVSFFDEITAEGTPLNDRHFRYCINRFKRLRASGLAEHAHDHVTDNVLGRLESMPDSADVFVDYLSLFPRSEEVQLAVLDFLDGAYNIYPWQEMTLLELLARADIAPSCLDRTLAVARSSASVGRHPACRAKALTLWGKNGDYADRREIRSGYDGEAREDIRRAIVVAIQEMQTSERDNFYRRVVSGSQGVGRTAEYVQSLPEPTYHYYNPPRGYDLLEVYEDSDDLDDLSDEHLVY